MSPRPDVSEERRNQILEAATTVFARLGFQQARMDDIALEVGLSKGTLYLYYKSKDAIIASLLEALFTQEMEHLRLLVDEKRQRSIREQILTLTQQMAVAMQEMKHLMPISFEFYAVAGRDQEVREYLKAFYQDYRALLATLIQRGIERQEFRSVNADTVAITLTALYEGAALLFFVDPEVVGWAEQVTLSVSLILDGLTTSKV